MPDLPLSFPDDFGLLDLRINYPPRQAFYQVSVRHIECLPTASFRSLIAQDTLAFDYRIPVISAPSGLSPVSLITCPAHLIFRLYVALRKMRVHNSF